MPRRRRRSATIVGSLPGSARTFRASATIVSRDRELTRRSNGWRATTSRLTYQSPSAVSDAAALAVTGGSAGSTFRVALNTTTIELILACCLIIQTDISPYPTANWERGNPHPFGSPLREPDERPCRPLPSCRFCGTPSDGRPAGDATCALRPSARFGHLTNDTTPSTPGADPWPCPVRRSSSSPV